MEGNLNTSDVLLNRGLNGYGYGYYDSGNFKGDGSAVKEGIRGNRDISLLDSVNTNASQNFLSNQIRQHNDSVQHDISVGNNFLTDRITAQGLDNKFATIERIMFANKADTDRDLKAIQLKQVECCCEAKAGLAAINAKLDADRAGAAESEVNNLRLQLQIVNQGRGSQGN